MPRPLQQRRCIRLPVIGEVDPLACTQEAIIHVGDREIEIRITYLGPLPS